MIHYCFFTGSYSRYDPLMFERQGKSLIQAGYKVTYIVCDDKPNEVVDGIEICSTNFNPKNRYQRFFLVKRKLLHVALSVDADIYQISDPQLISCVNVLKKHGKKVIFNMREYYPDMLKSKSYIPKYLRPSVALLYKFLQKKSLKKYDAVFVVTTWILEIVKKEWNIEKSYLLTNFPIVDKKFCLSYEEYQKRENILCYEGTIYKSSRQENVFKALEHIPDVHYLLAGKIDENSFYIKDLPYWKNVEFVDGFTSKELKKILRRSTMANVFRDFGKHDGSLGVIKIFECMEAALPVLMADVPLYRFIVSKYHCGICVNPNDPVQIERAIRYLIDNKREAYLMGQNGRRAVLEEYNWENQAKKYIQVIKEL